MVEIGRRRRRRRWILAPILVAALIAVLAVVLSPTVVATAPVDGETLVSTGSELRLTFSRPMDQASAEASVQITPATIGQLRWEDATLVFRPDDLWPNATEITVSVRAGARSSLGVPMLFGRTVVFATAEPSLLYLRNDGSGPRLFRLGLQTAEATEIPLDGNDVIEFSLATGGQLATLERAAAGQLMRLRRLNEPQAPGLAIPCPSDRRCGELALSPDSAWLAWVETALTVSETGVAARGENQVRLLATGDNATALSLDSSASLRSPHWVDGTHLAAYAVEAEQLWQYQLTAGGWVQVARVPHRLGEQWSWSPDGRFVVFPEIVLLERPPAGADTEYYSHLMRVEIASGLETDLSGSAAALLEDASPVYSPDGLQIAFARRSLLRSEWTPGRQLWLMRSDGGAARQLSDQGNLMHSQITWRPDGAGLAFVITDPLATDSEIQLAYYDLDSQQTFPLVSGGYAPQWIR